MNNHLRRTKIVCTIGPKTANKEMLSELMDGGLDIVRLNFSHGTHEWHGEIIDTVHSLNKEKGMNVAVMLDTKGPEIRSGDLTNPLELKTGDKIIFSTERLAEYPKNTVSVNYEGFIDDVAVGDLILVDSGMMNLKVEKIADKKVECVVVDGGTLTSRRHLNIKGKSANLPAITEKDWEDIKFGVEKGVDYFALSFVNDAPVVEKLKEYLKQNNSHAHVMSKIESVDGVKNIDAIIKASDAIMVARGDLGAELPVEDVPMAETDIVHKCREAGKPVVVATQLLESMMVNPTPTRAEVTDIYYAVLLESDAIMMSGETANGNYPLKALATMDVVAKRTEKDLLLDKVIYRKSGGDNKGEIAIGGAKIANNINGDVMIVFSKTGETAKQVSMCRPNSPIFTFVHDEKTARRTSLLWAVKSFVLPFNDKNPEESIRKAMQILLKNGKVMYGDKAVVISNIVAGDEEVHAIQIRDIKQY